MDNCIFCKIVNGEIPSYKVYEDSNYIAFLDLAQFTKGHTLVIPKKHHTFVWDVDDSSEYFKVASTIANHYRKKLGYKYVDSAIFGRDVPHAHIHLVPHNGDKSTDWESALKSIGTMQQDRSRWPTKEDGVKIQDEFTLPKFPTN